MTTREEWIRGMSRSDMLANLTARRDQAAEKVRQLIRDCDAAGEPVDDENGSLAKSMRLVGLDLDAMIADVRGSGDPDTWKGVDPLWGHKA
jgi:hypothetical protein